MGIGLGVADTISEVCRDNPILCSQIQEQHIRHMIDLIVNCGRYARY